MKIGIDIDGVLLDSEKQFRIAAEIYDATVLKKNSLIGTDEPRVQQRYGWNEEELKGFMDNIYEYSKRATVMPGAVETVKYLKELGHEIIIITARGNYDIRMKEEAKQKLEAAGLMEGIEISKYYWQINDKLAICNQENVEYMIDDFYKVCQITSENGIKTLYLREANLKKLEETSTLKEVNNWGEIYRFFYEIEKIKNNRI